MCPANRDGCESTWLYVSSIYHTRNFAGNKCTDRRARIRFSKGLHSTQDSVCPVFKAVNLLCIFCSSSLGGKIGLGVGEDKTGNDAGGVKIATFTAGGWVMGRDCSEARGIVRETSSIKSFNS